MEHRREAGHSAQGPGRWMPFASTFPLSAPHLAWALGRSPLKALDRAKSIQKEMGTGGKDALGPA